MLALVVVACGPVVPAATPTSPAPRQELTVGVAGDTQRTDIRADLGMYPVHAQVYDTLVRMDDQFSPSRSWPSGGNIAVRTRGASRCGRASGSTTASPSTPTP